MNLILFDGPCPLCHKAVHWIAAHDKKDLFRYSTLQGETAKQFALPKTDSVVLIEDFDRHPKIYIEGEALKRIAPRFKWIPTKMLNWAYRKIAKERYRLCRCTTDLSHIKPKILP
ncbi:MAG: DUF393 domain-containing protein [Chlamydiales bacterium]|nr:DUF393 domain-containing protein [Chlamydiales bacterium]